MNTKELAYLKFTGREPDNLLKELEDHYGCLAYYFNDGCMDCTMYRLSINQDPLRKDDHMIHYMTKFRQAKKSKMKLPKRKVVHHGIAVDCPNVIIPACGYKQWKNDADVSNYEVTIKYDGSSCLETWDDVNCKRCLKMRERIEKWGIR